MAAVGIPVLDYSDLASGRRDTFLRALNDALEEWGFVALENHGVSPALLDGAYTLARQTFALPGATKRRYETPHDGRQRGYTAYGIEHAKDCAVPDLKEFWHVGRELPSGHPLRVSGDLPSNLFPSEVPSFRSTFLALFDALDAVAIDLLEAIGTRLELPPGTFRTLTRDGNSVLRVIHYPPLHTGAPAGAVRAAAHEDINLITILPVSTEPGLELLTRDGRWMSIDPPPGVLVCDTGDMMQLLTGGRIPATTHRVVNPEQDAHKPRFSMPFFCHPHPDAWLRPLAGDATPVRARDFLRERLIEIGVSSSPS